MASLDSIIAPRTDCSATTSCGGSGALRLLWLKSGPPGKHSPGSVMMVLDMQVSPFRLCVHARSAVATLTGLLAGQEVDQAASMMQSGHQVFRPSGPITS